MTCKSPPGPFSLDERAKMIVEAIENQMAHYVLMPSPVPAWTRVFSTEQEYVEYCANPMQWARDFIETRLSIK
jgi:hypothetical protein